MKAHRHAALLSALLILTLPLLTPAKLVIPPRAPPNCTIPPFALPFANVSTFSDPNLPVRSRGIETYLGGLQKLSIFISTTSNNTFILDGDSFCNNTERKFRECVFWNNGFFARSSSVSWTQWAANDSDRAAVGAYNGTSQNWGQEPLARFNASTPDPFAAFPKGWDTLTLGASPDSDIDAPVQPVTIEAFPLTIITNSTFPVGAHSLGLASSSVFLETAVRTGKAPSHAWALDYGTLNPYRPGELVVGGYNPAKLPPNSAATPPAASNPFSFPVFADRNIPCPLQVRITGMDLGGHDLLAGDAAFTACLEPTVRNLILPLKVQRRFNESLLALHPQLTLEHVDWDYSYYTTADGITLTHPLTLTLAPNPSLNTTTSDDDDDDGITITIPSSELAAPRRQLDYKSGWRFTPGELQVAVGNGSDMPELANFVRLGAPALSQMYVIVDYESGRFEVRPVRRGSDEDAARKDAGGGGQVVTPREELVQLGCEGFEGAVEYGRRRSGGGFGGGRVAGAVVGILGGAAVGVAVWWGVWWRGRKGGAGRSTGGTGGVGGSGGGWWGWRGGKKGMGKVGKGQGIGMGMGGKGYEPVITPSQASLEGPEGEDMQEVELEPVRR
ncbi:hypothetical protein EDC01DRAFT_752048 [Geopyxis carbonaria]|nr:hypothetical protein EDC01DRAFT_752048 [Geopyxis carbonaria]